MIQRLSEMLHHPDPAVRRQGIELAEALAEQPALHPAIRAAQEGAGGFFTGVIAALMLRLPADALAVSPDRVLFLALPFNLPELEVLARRPRQDGVYIVDKGVTDPLSCTFPAHLSLLTLHFLQSRVLLDAVVSADLPGLTDLTLDQVADGVDLSGLCRLPALRALSVRSSPGVCLTRLPGDLDRLEVERSALSGGVLREAGGLSALSITDCALTGALQLPMPGALRQVRLEGLALTEVPEDLLVQPDLAVLSLRRNKITALPEPIWALSGLSELRLSGNRLSVLPETIGQLTGLRLLDLSSNQLTALPESMAALTGLETLRLSDNPLAVLPAALSALRSLKTLSIERTGLTAIPSCLHGLPALTDIELRGVRIRRFPPPEALPALQRLRVDRSCEGAAMQWARQRAALGYPPLLVR